MDSLNIDEIEESAATRLEVAKKAKELSALVSRVFPGFGVYIEKRDHSNSTVSTGKAGSLARLSGVEQIETVLSEANCPVFKRDLLGVIKSRSGTLNLETLTSYLSRYDQFLSKGKGMWELDKSKMNGRNGHEKAGANSGFREQFA